ncbi:transposase [Ottowia sp.]|uniref:transposase n=1 Tax=Ottowia sp. TaxID=1898956 RepID=UPI003C75A3BD
MTSDKPDTRRRYSRTTKEQVVAQCAEPGASVAKIAMAHGINANGTSLAQAGPRR